MAPLLKRGCPNRVIPTEPVSVSVNAPESKPTICQTLVLVLHLLHKVDKCQYLTSYRDVYEVRGGGWDRTVLLNAI